MLLINCISTFSYADEDATTTPTTTTTTTESSSSADVSLGFEDPTPLDLTPQRTGTAEVVNDNNQKLEANVSGSTYSIPQVFKTIVNIFFTILRWIMNLLIEIPNFAQEEIGVSTEDEALDNGVEIFTIYDTVMGNYKLFNIDFSGTISDEDTTLAGTLKANMVKFFNYARNIAIALSLFVLVYVGIRMLVSTVASEKAEYKRMLVDWGISLLILFSMQYIIIIISVVIDAILETFSKISETWQVDQFETDICLLAFSKIAAKGFNAFTSLAMLFVLVWYQIKFFMFYAKRLLEVYMLVIISPLVTVTYAIDKAGDRKAQAFGAFLGELISKLSIQPIHAMLYIAFVSTAGAIAQSQPLLAVIFFYAIGRSEKIVRKIFSVMSGKGEAGMSEQELPFG